MGDAHKNVVVVSSGFEARIKGCDLVITVGTLGEPLALEQMVEDVTDWLDAHAANHIRGPLADDVEFMFAGLYMRPNLCAELIFDPVN